MQKFFRSALVGVLLLPIFGQTAANQKLEILVKDSDGLPIAGVRVELTAGQRLLKSTETDVQGRVSLPNLNPGRYGVVARTPGFQPIVRTDIDLSQPGGTVLELTMRPEQAKAESVEVRGTVMEVEE